MISLDEQNGIEKAFYLTYHAGAKWVYRLFESGVPTEVQQGLSLRYLEYENMRIAIEMALLLHDGTRQRGASGRLGFWSLIRCQKG